MIFTKDINNKVFDYLYPWGETLAYIAWAIIAVITNPGGTRKMDNPLKGIRNPITWNPDNPLNGIWNPLPNGILIQWPRGLTLPS